MIDVPLRHMAVWVALGALAWLVIALVVVLAVLR